METIDLTSIAERAPAVFAQLAADADGEAPEAFLATRPGGLAKYVSGLTAWCEDELERAEERPRLLAIAGQVRERATVPAGDVLDLLTRYQVALDNQLTQALRALREAQEWRLKTLEGSQAEPSLPEGAPPDA